MYRAILVPLDGSPLGEHALPIALGIARRSGALLHLTTAHVPMDRERPEPDRRETAAHRQAQRYLDAVAARLDTGGGVQVRTAVRSEAVVTALCEEAAAIAADLIVMTTHGRRGLARLWFGSVAEGVMRRSRIPTLLVHPDEEPADITRERTFRHVLVPLDGSEYAHQVLEHAIAIGGPGQARFTLMRVVGTEMAGMAEMTEVTAMAPVGLDAELDAALLEQQIAWAESYVRAVADRVAARGLAVEYAVRVSVDPATAILDAARGSDADLVAMTTYGRGFAWSLAGSVADRVLRASPVPVLVLRPRAD